MLTRLLERAANAVTLAYYVIDLLQWLRCGRREPCDRQCSADIRVVMAATKAGQTSRGILVKHLHVVTAKTSFDAFAIH
jgi:hypothetical protein